MGLLSTMTFFPLAATFRPIFDVLMFSFPENQNNSANKVDSTPYVANSERQLQRVSVRFSVISFDLIPRVKLWFADLSSAGHGRNNLERNIICDRKLC